MKIGPYEIIHHTETVKAESYVVFWTVNGKFQRALHLGKRGGFKTLQEAIDAVNAKVKFGTTKI